MAAHLDISLEKAQVSENKGATTTRMSFLIFKPETGYYNAFCSFLYSLKFANCNNKLDTTW